MKIFIADYLPLANKGEEEILRGIETLFNRRGDEKITFSVFGDVSDMVKIDNVTVYPKNYCYPDYSQKGKMKTLIGLWWALLGFFNIYPYKKRINKNNAIIDDFRESDTILIGHDGFFNIRCAMLGNYLHRKGLYYGILGAGFNKPSKKIAWIYNLVYKRCFDSADYVILREQTAYNYVKSISKNNIIKLFPDPAFFCPSNAYNKERIECVLSKYSFDKDEGMKIGMTICEDSISFSHSFVDARDKVVAHREFIAKLMYTISEKYKCTFYFLPHCIKEGKGNDLLIAKDIKTRLHVSVNCKIIDEDLPVLDLKYIIARMDYMIGERTHSIINSIATATPFVSLTCSADFRTHDIVGSGCGLQKQIYDMDFPNVNDLFDIIDNNIKEEQKLTKALRKLVISHELLKKEFQEII